MKWALLLVVLVAFNLFAYGINVKSIETLGEGQALYGRMVWMMRKLDKQAQEARIVSLVDSATWYWFVSCQQRAVSRECYDAGGVVQVHRSDTLGNLMEYKWTPFLKEWAELTEGG